MNDRLVWKSDIIVDNFERPDLGDYYWFNDPNQTELPRTSERASYEKAYGLVHPYGHPNDTVSLSADNPGYDATLQSETLEHYPGPDRILEFYLKPVQFSDPALARFSFNLEEYGHRSCLRLLIDYTGYWRLESIDSKGDWSYYGDEPQEDVFQLDVGDWHRVVIDQTNWPDVSAHIWNAETGEHTSSLETSGGSGVWDNDGFGLWVNDHAEVQLDYLHLIKSDDYIVGTDM
ncbi:hypothetical protein [Natrinema gelatinilyticum]|uniref:hypothetical protein n=1 Tax=Natrinema gelatinilyticum TaxID=2961571 RepID=UPI0020C2D16F|nr:hypothetical protein [Natrinema gelatinilyticum]